MSEIFCNHCTEVTLDFGVIGEQCVDVFYDWHEANPSNDPLQVPEPAYPEIHDVLLFIDGQEVSIMHWLSFARLEVIEELIREKWE